MDVANISQRVRRRAALATLCCFASVAHAEDTKRSFRSLIASGWQNIQPAEQVTKTLKAPVTTAGSVAFQQQPVPTDKAVSPAATPQPALIVSAAGPPRALAELIKSQARTIPVPKPTDPIEVKTTRPAPAVQRTDPDLRDSIEFLPAQVANPLPPVQAANPIATLTAVDQITLPPNGMEPPGGPPPSETSMVAETETDPVERLESSSLPATGKGFELLPLPEVQPDAPAVSHLTDRGVPPALNPQAIRLQEAARQSLRIAQQRLQRRATFSARMYAEAVLSNIVAMQDAQHGGNAHARQLDAALDAIRESRDFSGSVGAVDPDALERMVTVHETETLKDCQTSELSAAGAAEAYLDSAVEHLRSAVGGSREASEALVMLGKIERIASAPEDAHATAVAQAMQQAAIAIAPHNAAAHRELGATLNRQGRVHTAADSLVRSIALQPTRSAYKELLAVSRKRGDIDTARACLAALNSGNVPNEIPVRTIAPERFAATHRPSASAIRRARTAKQHQDAEVQQTAARADTNTWLGLPSLFQRR